MIALHLHAVEDVPIPEPLPTQKITPVYLVIQRANGHWSVGAKIITVCDSEDIAEAFASQQKTLHPQQAFGVFVLRSEARTVMQPIEIVRTFETPQGTA